MATSFILCAYLITALITFFFLVRDCLIDNGAGEYGRLQAVERLLDDPGDYVLCVIISIFWPLCVLAILFRIVVKMISWTIREKDK